MQHPLHPLSLKEAAIRSGLTERQIIGRAEAGKLPICFRHHGWVALFRSYGKFMSPDPAGDSILAPGIYRSLMRPILEQEDPLVASIFPTAVELVEAFDEPPPDVPNGHVLARVTGSSITLDSLLRLFEEPPRPDAPRLDGSPVPIENWLFLPEDIDRVAAECRPASVHVVPHQAAPEVAPGDGETGELVAEPKQKTDSAPVLSEATKDVDATPTWQEHARAIAGELHAKDTATGCYDSVKHVSARVEVVMRERKIFGPRGPVSKSTILREALQGGKWQRKP